MLIVIDNYDSFTYNLVQYLGEMGCPVEVYRNDQITIPEILARDPDGIVISPGPGRPEEAGVSLQVWQELGPQLPILGVCLGHQALGQVFGGRVIHAPTLMHGKTSAIAHRGVGVFADLPQGFTATRYHSLVVEASSLPAVLEVTAWVEGDPDLIMGLQHRQYPWLQGVQFHPESVLTSTGKQLLANFVRSTHRVG
ncbi:MAG: aminodeoxychorismate/anthranilate synthase component II [Thermostichales cyanobacterium BF4_bins_65]